MQSSSRRRAGHFLISDWDRLDPISVKLTSRTPKQYTLQYDKCFYCGAENPE